MSAGVVTFTLAAFGVIAVPALARAGLMRCGALNTFRVSMFELIVASMVGALLAATYSLLQGGPSVPAFWYFPGLAVMAWMDRISAWAPTEPLIAVMVSTGAMAFPDNLSLVLPVTAAALVVTHGAWEIQARLGVQVISPADMIALSLPCVMMGLKMETVVAYVLVSVMILAALKVDRVARFLSRCAAVEDGAKSTGVSGPAITFLPVMFPIIAFVTILETAKILS